MKLKVFDDIKKENHFFYSEFNSQEAKFWEEIVNKYIDFPNNEEKFKRLTKLVHKYRSLCDVCGKISRFLVDIKTIKSQ